MKPWLVPVVMFVALACGGREASLSDGGDGGETSAALCSITVGGMTINSGAPSTSANTFACPSSTINGHQLNCGSGAPTIQQVRCSDGFGYVVAGGDVKLFLRFKGGSSWQAGAIIENGSSPLTGQITAAGIPMPGKTAPDSGADQSLAFYFQSTSNGQNITGNGTLKSRW